MSAFNRKKIPSDGMDALLVDHDYLYQEVCKLFDLLQKHKQPDAAILLREPVNNLIDRKTHIFHRIDYSRTYFFIRSTSCEPFNLNSLSNYPEDLLSISLLSITRLKRLLEHYTGDPIYVVLPESNIKQIQFRPIFNSRKTRIEYVLLERKED